MSHPVWQKEEVRVRFPRPMEIESESETIEDVTFQFSFSAQSVGETLIVSREYRSRAEIVPGEDLQAHLARLDRVREHLSFEVPNVPSAPERKPFTMGRSEWTIVGVVGGVVVSGTFLALWLPGRRRRAFRKKRNGTAGEQPTYPISAADADTAMQSVSKWRCSCGQRLDAGANEARWSEFRFGGATLHLLHVTCHQCGTSMRRYFALGAPPAPAEATTALQ